MGIPGLLPSLRSITTDVTLESYSGLRAGVDAYSWLYKGLYSCCLDVAQGIPTRKYVNYCMKRCELLVQNHVTPVLVFDGGDLPGKAGMDSQRAAARTANYDRGMRLIEEGKMAEAQKCLQKGLNVTPEICSDLITALKAKGIQFVVAPYEADAQMAFMCRNKIVDVIITEDSDLLLYKCPVIMYKMDACGCGQEIKLRHLGACEDLCFLNWTHDMFMEM